MNSKILLLILISSFLLTSAKAEDPCQYINGTDGVKSTCPDLYFCNQATHVCEHKDIFPMTDGEIIGTILIMLVTGLANSGGSSGTALTTLLLVIFFNYTENKAVMIAYALVFGGALGNFMNVGFGRNPATGRSLINYDIALICMPPMLMGTSMGIIINRMVAPFLITIGLAYVMYISVGKIYAKAIKEYKEEPSKLKKSAKQQKERNRAEAKSPVSPLEALQNDDEILISEEWRELIQEEFEIFPKKKLTIIVALLLSNMTIAFLKGTKKFDSILGLEYCSNEYWGIYLLGIVICLMFLLWNRRNIRKATVIKRLMKINMSEGEFEVNDHNTGKLVKSSLIAGIVAGLLGMGGSTIMGPVLLSLGVGVESVVATSGFFVVQTSFTSLFQSALYGDISLLELVFFMVVTFVGSYGISFIISNLVKRYRRPSIVLFILVFIFSSALVIMPFFEIYKGIQDPGEMFAFNSLCG